jgi:hypothetical protein
MFTAAAAVLLAPAGAQLNAAYDDGRDVLRRAASVTDLAKTSNRRFFLDTADEIDPATTAREEVMDRRG